MPILYDALCRNTNSVAIAALNGTIFPAPASSHPFSFRLPLPPLESITSLESKTLRSDVDGVTSPQPHHGPMTATGHVTTLSSHHGLSTALPGATQPHSIGTTSDHKGIPSPVTSASSAAPASPIASHPRSPLSDPLSPLSAAHDWETRGHWNPTVAQLSADVLKLFVEVCKRSTFASESEWAPVSVPSCHMCRMRF